MTKKLEKLSLADMTQQKVYKLFGIHKVYQMQELDEWLSDLPELNDDERVIARVYQTRLLENIDAWNEQELSLGFIGPILNAIPFKVPYQLNLFAQRQISATIGNYLLSGKPDSTIASGLFEPEIPYFCFQEFKKEQDNSGDPVGQNLAAMLVGQTLNGDDRPIYGCYVVGRNWFFMLLKGQNYAVSKDFSATDDILDILKTLKALRIRLFRQLNIKLGQTHERLRTEKL